MSPGRRRGAAAALVALSMALTPSCGGGGSTSSGAGPALAANVVRAGTTLTVVSGETDRPVAGAHLTLAGRSYLTDAAGQVLLAEDTPKASYLDIVADGFLDRQTLLRTETELRFSLWPRSSEAAGLDEQTTAELSFTSGTECCPAVPESFAKRGLRRFRQGVNVALAVDPLPGLDTPVMLEALQHAADLANAANEGRVVFKIVAPSGGPFIKVTIDANTCGANALGCMSVNRDGQGYITRGQLTLTDEPTRLRFGLGGPLEVRLAGILAHELGHALGFGHSSRLGVMSVVNGRGTNIGYFDRTPDFSKTEKLLLSLAAQRRPNTVFPDNDREGPFTIAAAQDEVVCVF